MILGFSTSSPWASVAAIDETGQVQWQGKTLAPQSASSACMALLEKMKAEAGYASADFATFAADIGPGSFTGVRVGVVLAKTFAFLYNGHVLGATAFELISAHQTVVLPSKRGEYFVKPPKEDAHRTEVLPDGVVGYGGDVRDPVFPEAARLGAILPGLTPQDPFSFAPDYLIEPSISLPKRPYAGPADAR